MGVKVEKDTEMPSKGIKWKKSIVVWKKKKLIKFRETTNNLIWQKPKLVVWVEGPDNSGTWNTY